MRSQIESKTTVGLEAKKFMDAGDLVPDEVILELMDNELGAYSNSNWILDGQ